MNEQMRTTIDKITSEARGSGDDCARRVEAFLLKMLADYSGAFGVSQEQLLEAVESKRNYYAPNYYQEATFPSLNGVRVFATQADLLEAFPSRQFVCPACEAISSNPYACNSGKLDADGRVCDWKAYGLLRTLGKGLRFTIREGFLDHPRIDEIFMPLEMAEVQA